ncbi:hypothetical protein, partial [Mycobacterium sp.]|uniref:hypothetical protein n=1 Tax=Mycobacterium sp. TaxID=1785 RepID=UPI003F945678
ATLTRNDIHYHGTNATVPTLAEPTPDQRRAFDLIGTPTPLTARSPHRVPEFTARRVNGHEIRSTENAGQPNALNRRHRTKNRG